MLILSACSLAATVGVQIVLYLPGPGSVSILLCPPDLNPRAHGFRSPHKPARGIPVTGYRSHMASMEDIAAANGPEAYARSVVLSERRLRVRGYGSVLAILYC